MNDPKPDPPQANDRRLGRHAIGVYDGRFSREKAANWCERFDQDTAIQPGRAGGKVDPATKDSDDLEIASLPMWQSAHQELHHLFWQCLSLYARECPHLVTSSLRPQVSLDHREELEILPEHVAQLSPPALQVLLEQIYVLSPLHLQRYRRNRGGFTRWHSEIYPSVTDFHPLRRVVFGLAYLNTVDEGGTTDFAVQGLRLQPLVGRVVIAPCGFTHTHRGTVPTSGDKYVATGWFEFR